MSMDSNSGGGAAQTWIPCIFWEVRCCPRLWICCICATLCAYTTALCTVFVTTTLYLSQLCFQLLTGPTWLCKNTIFTLEFVFATGVHPVHLIILHICPRSGRISEEHLCISSLSAPLFSHHRAWHIGWEGCPKRERWFTEWIFFFINKQWVIHIPFETEENLSSSRGEHQC